MIINFDKDIFYIYKNKLYKIKSYDDEELEYELASVHDNSKEHVSRISCGNIKFSNRDDDEDPIKYIISLGIMRFIRLPQMYHELVHPTEDKMKELISKLKEIENDDTLKTQGKFYKECKIINEAEDLACYCLIGYEGSNNHSNIAKLKEEGFRVYPIERDSFGWLIGGIQNKKAKVITYG